MPAVEKTLVGNNNFSPSAIIIFFLKKSDFNSIVGDFAYPASKKPLIAGGFNPPE